MDEGEARADALAIELVTRILTADERTGDNFEHFAAPVFGEVINGPDRDGVLIRLAQLLHGMVIYGTLRCGDIEDPEAQKDEIRAAAIAWWQDFVAFWQR